MLSIVFRVDASLAIGTGHIMRCLSLADGLRKQGATCVFLCRELEGNLNETVKKLGYAVIVMPRESRVPIKIQNLANPAYAEYENWLGTTQNHDAAASASIIKTAFTDGIPDVLVVDHYALDAAWEIALRPFVKKIFVIDDLANRQHHCDWLLDQTFGRHERDYASKVLPHVQLFCGSQFALLRSEFSTFRDASIQRREQPKLKNIFVNLGGVDKDNLTLQVLAALKQSNLSADIEVTVIMGKTSLHIDSIKEYSTQLSYSTKVLVGVNDMALLMTQSDLAIGAAGSSSWERCCLGLPTIMLVTAENQIFLADQFKTNLEGWVIDCIKGLEQKQLVNIVNNLILFPEKLRANSELVKRVTDGSGATFISKIISNRLTA